jgi:hypothetical protein
MLSDQQHLAAREEMDRLMPLARQPYPGLRIAEARDHSANGREWAVVHDEGGKVLDLLLLFHSDEPRAIAAFLAGIVALSNVAERKVAECPPS